MSQQQNNDMQQHFYRASAADFGKIPGSPIAYSASKNVINAFGEGLFSEDFISDGSLKTGNNDRFIRFHWEINDSDRGIRGPWRDHPKGGDFRRWSGNKECVVRWDKASIAHYQKDFIARILSEKYWDLEGISWSAISSGEPSFRMLEKGDIANNAALCIFPKEGANIYQCLGYLNSKLGSFFIKYRTQTLNFLVGDVMGLPKCNVTSEKVSESVEQCIKLSNEDWNIYETSWNFSQFSLLNKEFRHLELQAVFQNCRVNWRKNTLEILRLEEENNRIFIDAYGLQDELTPEVPLSEITLTCNPHYRYGGNLTDEEREARLQSDTLCELISYAIGCMMGRYSLDLDGLVYAHAGNEGFKALVEAGAYATFAADDDGILPLTSENWFADDVAARIEAFVATVWGKELLEENLNFIADSLTLYAVKPAKKGGETARETLRRYLSTQFYKDHLKTYKKRPIYWLFSSGKEKAFECLVYLHRYSESTLPRMRTEYVTPLLGQMAGRIDRLRLQQAEASTAEAKRLGKEIDSLTKQLTELRAFDDELKHHADMRITLDLDDGVKVNYGKFGTLLSDVKAITGDKGE
ncbi:BREX-1 system adenine-specific DNA-methyltransferase PglX [Aeromonas rivipollensis]|uniref:BREX-1 system adenine-specific DNA-methyltransferase PglX n=1 Tax=Aeromonas rivipollensis TaxID=948519 RepID=UPI003D22EC40